MHQNLRIVEALLFACKAPLKPIDIAARLPQTADVGAILSELKKTYSTRGVNLVERDGAFAFRTARDLDDALDLDVEEKKPLSRAAMEVLSIIAYHQPVTRAEIEAVRGVSTQRSTLDILVDARWVKTGRRRETHGRPITWITTPEFLDNFSLDSLESLPNLSEMKDAGLIGAKASNEPDLLTPLSGEK